MIGNALFGGLGLTIQRDVAGRGLIPGRNNANQRLGDLLFGHAHGIVIRTVRGAFRANRYMAARQFRFIPFGHDILQSKR